MNKYIFMALAIIVSVLVWSVFWKYIAWSVDQEFDREIARLKSQGVELSCSTRHVSGYPFNIAVNCDGVTIKTAEMEVELAGLKANALIYDWQRIILLAQSPAQFYHAQTEEEYAFEWDVYKANIQLQNGLFLDTNHHIEQLSVFNTGLDDEAILTAKQVNLSISNQLGPVAKLGVRITDGDLALFNLPIERAGCIASLSKHQVQLNAFLPNWKEWNTRQGQLSLQDCLLQSGESEVVIEGRGQLRSNGLIDGKFPVRVSNLEQLAKKFPPIRLLSSVMTGPRDFNGQKTHESLLHIRKGEVLFGFIRIARLSPIF